MSTKCWPKNAKRKFFLLIVWFKFSLFSSITINNTSLLRFQIFFILFVAKKIRESFNSIPTLKKFNQMCDQSNKLTLHFNDKHHHNYCSNTSDNEIERVISLFKNINLQESTHSLEKERIQELDDSVGIVGKSHWCQVRCMHHWSYHNFYIVHWVLLTVLVVAIGREGVAVDLFIENDHSFTQPIILQNITMLWSDFPKELQQLPVDEIVNIALHRFLLGAVFKGHNIFFWTIIFCHYFESWWSLKVSFSSQYLWKRSRTEYFISPPQNIRIHDFLWTLQHCSLQVVRSLVFLQIFLAVLTCVFPQYDVLLIIWLLLTLKPRVTMTFLRKSRQKQPKSLNFLGYFFCEIKVLNKWWKKNWFEIEWF